MIRDFKASSSLFLDAISTFNSAEVISYNELVKYTVLTSMMSLKRSELKEKVNNFLIIKIKKGSKKPWSFEYYSWTSKY